MTEVNKNIINAYRSMYEQKEEVLDETNKNDKSDDGEGLDAVQPKAVKKKFDDRKDKDIDNDGDVDSSDKYLHKRRKAVSKAIEKEGNAFTKQLMAAKEKGETSFIVNGKKYDVKTELNKLEQKESFTLDDIREMCHSKDHDCATYVDHPEFGLGKPVYESHAIPNDDGSVDWYDVEFAHGIEKEVPAEDMQILQTEDHKMNAKKNKDDEKMIKGQKKKMVDEEDEEEEEPKMMDSDEKPMMKKKKPPMPPKKDNGEEDDVEEPKDDGDDVKIISKNKKKSKQNGDGKTAEISKIGEELEEFTSLISELMAVDAVGKKKKEKDASKEKEEIGDTASDDEQGFKDAHGKKDVVVDADDAIKQTTKTAQDTKKGKHVKGQTAKGDTNVVKSTEAPAKNQTESTLMQQAVEAIKNKTMFEIQDEMSIDSQKNAYDGRRKEAKEFLKRMETRKDGKGTMVKDKDPKDLPMQPKELPTIKGEK